MGKLIIADRTGHSEMDWTGDNKQKTKEASDKFTEMLSKGYFGTAWHGDSSKPENGKVIRDFDETADEVKMFPHLVGG